MRKKKEIPFNVYEVPKQKPVKTYKLMVYGTLKKGFGNHHLLGDSKFLGVRSIKKYTLLSSGDSFPVAINKRGKYESYYITGELYAVTKETLEKIDRIEYGAGFDRIKIQKTNFYLMKRQNLKGYLKAGYKEIGPTWPITK